MGRTARGAQRQQSGLRVIVLFTDGASNSVPGNYPAQAALRGRCARSTSRRTCRTRTVRRGTTRRSTGCTTPTPARVEPVVQPTVANWNDTTTARSACRGCRPTSWHAHHRSAGIPTSFPLQTNALNVNGIPQITKRGAADTGTRRQGRYPAEVFNINNAARNLLEIIANEARNDNGDYKIRIYTIGMGDLVRYNLGTMPEKPEDILKRIANDSVRRTSTTTSSKASTTSRRPPPMWPRVPAAAEPDHSSEQVSPHSPPGRL